MIRRALMSRLNLLCLALVLAMLAASLSPAAGQQPPPVTPASSQTPQSAQPGDVLWTFAPEMPFRDLRIALAIAIMIDPDLRTGGSRIFYTEIRGQDTRVYTSQPAALIEARLLLSAAGFPNGLGDLTVIGPCKVWSAPPPAEVTPSAQPEDVAGRLAELFRDSLEELGVQAGRCLTTQNLDEAHLVVWVEGGPRPALQDRGSTFLALPTSPAPTAPIVTPPSTGDAGLSAQYGPDPESKGHLKAQ